MIPTEKADKLTKYLSSVEDDDKSLSQLQYQGNLEPEAAVQTDETDVSRYGERI